MLTLGSLFDGIGVFPYAAERNGILPVWASPRSRNILSPSLCGISPNMLHLGDITKLDGGKIPAVHVLTFGSPCQNLSICGTRTGLAGEKSSLFFQAIRIIHEMRDASGGKLPVICLWENVMGAFTSNDGMDFRAVLGAFEDTEISMPASGSWAGAGMVRGRCPDLAWRLMDARYWAGPGRLARRQRISSWPILEGGVLTKYCLSPAQCSHFLALAQRAGCPPAERDRGSVIEAGGRVPILQPFQLYRMRGAAKHGQHTQFRGSFGRAADPFPTLLASGVTPFAFWYADDPAAAASVSQQKLRANGSWVCRTTGQSTVKTVS